VVVRSDDLTSPGAIAWMVDYQKRVLAQQGYREERPCREAKICPSLSLTNLFGSGQAERPRQIRALLEGLPSYFSQSVVSADRRTAIMAFGVRSMPLEQQKELVDAMRAELDPPPGVRAELAGVPVLLADGNADVESSRALLALVALAAVFGTLFAIYGRLERAVVPLIPVALALGWSALVVFALGIPLNPMSAALGALVVAITARFTVILAARFRADRAAGLGPRLRSSAPTGAPVERSRPPRRLRSPGSPL
jgi:predicted RND superfamily exporter protein